MAERIIDSPIQPALFEVEPLVREKTADLGGIAARKTVSPQGDVSPTRTQQEIDAAEKLLDEEYDKNNGRVSYAELANIYGLEWYLKYESDNNSSVDQETQPSKGIFCGDCLRQIMPGDRCPHIGVTKQKKPYANDDRRYPLVGRRH